MARQSYGQSWWGQQWLNSLTNIDYDNRLPRGRTYANKGAVRGLEMEKSNRFVAKVQGSRKRPYEVMVQSPQLTQTEKKNLLETVAQQPLIVAQLLNRELSPDVLKLAKKLQINLFPKNWKDLWMQCSCPDWAVPCKHIAAVIYLISRNIDGDPFLVFTLRGLDLLAELQKLGLQASIANQVQVPDLSLLLTRPFSNTSTDILENWQQLDFSQIPNLAESLPQLLAAQPLFYAQGDFRELYNKSLAKVTKASQRQLDSLQLSRTEDAESVRHSFTAQDKPCALIKPLAPLQWQGMGNINDWDSLQSALCRLTSQQAESLQPQVAALYQVYLFALHLLAKGAVIPEIFRQSGKDVGLRWIPAILDKTVAKLTAQLATLLPAGMVHFAIDSKAKTKPTILDQQQQIINLCSLVINELVFKSGKSVDVNKYYRLFFVDGSVQFNQAGESNIATGIAQWLSRFSLAQREQTPVLILKELNDRYLSLEIGIKLDQKQIEPVTLNDILQQEQYQNIRVASLQTVAMLADYYPVLNDYFAKNAKKPIKLDHIDLVELLFDAIPAIRLLGIQVLMPKSLETLLKPQLSVKIKAKTNASDSNGFINMGDLFNFDWQIALGKQMIEPTEFEQLVANANGIIRFKGEYIYIDSEQLAQIKAKLSKPAKLTGAELLHSSLSEQYQGAPIQLDAQARKLVRQITQVGKIELPKIINAELRPYQYSGFNWLVHNLKLGFGCVIADDMGLGKTLQVISSIAYLKQSNQLTDAKVLVVVPTSLLSNWQREIERFAPSLTVATFYGAKRSLAKEDRTDILLTTYGIARTETANLKKLSWRLLVVDEAQNIKNAATAQTKALKTIPAQSFIAMSGTPVENRLSEYWSIMDFAQRGYLGNLTSFVKNFAKPIQSDHDQQVIQRFRQITAPFILRRLKSDKSIINDLPDKIETDQFCELTPTQSAVYESVVREGMQVIKGQSDSFSRQGMVLQMIMALKQVCNHPLQYLKTGAADPQLSGKAQLLFTLLDAIFESPDKVLIFTQFKEMGDLLSQYIDERYQQQTMFLHGGLTRKKRDEMVERFQNDLTAKVFILSLKAGGTGLNLTAASHVIHYDLWWNPAVEAQATDRAYRIGQHKNVQVHRLLTKATFEEKINAMIQAKKQLAELTVSTGENWIGKLNDAELDQLFSLA